MPLNKQITAAVEKACAAAWTRFKEKGRPQQAVIIVLLFLLAVKAALIVTFPIGIILDRPASLVVTDKNGIPLRGSLSEAGEWRLPVPLSEMGRWMPAAAVALEDRRFYFHNGIDTIAIVRAMWQNITGGRVVSGASTITSQVVRLTVDRARTPAGKAVEFAQGTALEFFMDKDKILEIYLNSVPFGGNTRGVEAAARSWFGKPAREMSLAEAALLAGLLRGPAYYRPDRHPERALELRNRLINSLEERGAASAQEAMRAKAEPLPTGRTGISSLNIQAAMAAARFGGAAEARDTYGRFRSTLDISMQRLLSAELTAALIGMEPGITAAAILVENESGKVRGYVGNALEGTGGSASWVDCAEAPRSPGSVLKPFIYALAFESGKATPASMLADTPMQPAGGGTRNFDRLFRGPVSARTALADSLNVPAVRILRTVGAANTLGLFRRLGFSSLTRDAEWYGDSLALGGCEVSPLELARAYHTLASGGIDRPLVWNEKETPSSGTEVLSAEASALVLDILKDTRRNLPLYGDADSDGKIVAFKTGTSYGLRDAWTAAVTKKWTLIVWFGDPSGKPHRSLVGLRAAAPSAVRIMLKLTRKGDPWFTLPAKVVKKELCALSGVPRNQWCPQVRRDLVIEGVSDSEPCTLHTVANGAATIKWPAELETFFAERGAAGAGKHLVITSPKNGASYTIVGGAEKLVLSSEGGRGAIYWFIDGELTGDSGAGALVMWKMKPGTHKIAAADEYGTADEIEITVKRPAAKETDGLPLLEESL